MNIDKLKMANGTMLLKPTSENAVYEVVKVAPNVTYHGLKDSIEVGALVLLTGYAYGISRINGTDYRVASPKSIAGYFEV